MAALGIIGSVLGIANAGCRVTRGLYQIADAIGGAGEEVRLVPLDTEVFSQILCNLSDVLSKILGSSPPSRLIITMEDVLRNCEQILQPFEKILRRLKPLLERFKGNERKIPQIGLRIQWIFRHKEKLLFYHKMLNSLKSTLACLLATLNLQCSSDLDSVRTEIFRMQLENATTAMNHILEHTSSVQLLDNIYNEQLNRRFTSAGAQRQDDGVPTVGDRPLASTAQDARELAIAAILEVNPRTFEPHLSQRYQGLSSPGKSLRDLRQMGRVLVEDTKGTFHYLPSQVVNDWNSMKRFIHDLYTFGPLSLFDYKYRKLGGKSAWDINQGNNIFNEPTFAVTVLEGQYQFSQTPQLNFET